jgi:hypothetical protein
LTRGDTAYLTIPIKTATGEDYVLQKDDNLTMSVKRRVKDDEYSFQKVVTGNNTIHITPEDTASLPFGSYSYDIQLNKGNGDVYTIIDVSTFELLTEVTCE